MQIHHLPEFQLSEVQLLSLLRDRPKVYLLSQEALSAGKRHLPDKPHVPAASQEEAIMPLSLIHI